ncbi:LysE family translocator [Neorhizobium lilium]|uniref:LysE family translocator n=1 Tax=Neorhizobium lilium TaxID=2503024 RepID=A0A444LI55_9HYPH|nr:LysE family translocator [Neorhizobium lilium]RWX78635.1 LysE family translocator [Neorhizobium lilium]
MDATTLLLFAGAFFVFAASPGPDNVTIVARTVANGTASGIAYGLGTVAGILVFLLLACIGLSTVAAEMGGVMLVLRYAGAAYLIWMGLKLWFAEPVVRESTDIPGSGNLWKSFATGVLLNLGNPKMPLFYIALLPNVVGAELTLRQAFTMVVVILAVEAVVIGGHVFLASRARRMLKQPAMLRRLNRASGAVMVGAGVAAASVR